MLYQTMFLMSEFSELYSWAALNLTLWDDGLRISGAMILADYTKQEQFSTCTG